MVAFGAGVDRKPISSGEVEDQHLGVLAMAETELRLALQAERVAGCEGSPVDFEATANDMDPSPAPGIDASFGMLLAVEEAGRVRRVVELAVLHAAPGAHALHVARPDDAGRRALAATGAHAVFVRQLAFEHIADDFHIAMAVRAEAASGRDAILVDDAQVAAAHMPRVVIVGERKAVAALQPAVVGIAAVGRFAKRDHSGPFSFSRHDCRKPAPSGG